MEDSKQMPAAPWWRVALIGRRPKRTLLRAAILAVSSAMIFKFVLAPVRISGLSMEPTLHDKRPGLVNRMAYLSHGPVRGDIVAIRPRAGERAGLYLKRVIALPGETVGFHAGRLLINGDVKDEPYMRWPYAWEMDPIRLAADEYYTVGDNRNMPQEDHYQGKVPRERIVGRLFL